MTMDSGDGEPALDALLTLAGQLEYKLDALIDLLVDKGVFEESELEAVTGTRYRPGQPSPAEWARHCIDSDQDEALDRFFQPRDDALDKAFDKLVYLLRAFVEDANTGNTVSPTTRGTMRRGLDDIARLVPRRPH